VPGDLRLRLEAGMLSEGMLLMDIPGWFGWILSAVFLAAAASLAALLLFSGALAARQWRMRRRRA
jgi:hypothetical protein